MRIRNIFLLVVLIFIVMTRAFSGIGEKFLQDYNAFRDVYWKIYELAMNEKELNGGLFCEIFVKIDNKQIKPLEQKLRVWFDQRTREGKALGDFLKSRGGDEEVRNLRAEVDACFEIVRDDLERLRKSRAEWEKSCIRFGRRK